MFRHERPQSGRFRQFHQIDVEAIGSPGPAVDVEVVALLHHLLEAWGLRGLSLHVNSIGDPACRPTYRDAFLAYLGTHREALCPDCHLRMTKNPLRVLDCKQPGCREVAAKAPALSGFLCDACRDHFSQVRASLDSLKIAYEVDERLVRGLDYYTRTTFEFLNPARAGTRGRAPHDGLVQGWADSDAVHRLCHRRAHPDVARCAGRAGRDAAITACTSRRPGSDCELRRSDPGATPRPFSSFRRGIPPHPWYSLILGRGAGRGQSREGYDRRGQQEVLLAEWRIDWPACRNGRRLNEGWDALRMARCRPTSGDGHPQWLGGSPPDLGGDLRARRSGSVRSSTRSGSRPPTDAPRRCAPSTW
jgi:hypothetical protein